MFIETECDTCQEQVKRPYWALTLLNELTPDQHYCFCCNECLIAFVSALEVLDNSAREPAMRYVDLPNEADLLGDALYRILELTIGSELANADHVNNGWSVWGEYYNMTHRLSRPKTCGEEDASLP